MQELVEGVRFMAKLAAAPSLASVIAERLHPGPGGTTDDEIAADIRARAYSVFHPCGSCRMGPDPKEAAVDPRLRVHGLSGLRIVDSSIFPTVTSGNINAPTIMVGERGAELVLEDVR
jgi:choline dehydrogenase